MSSGTNCRGARGRRRRDLDARQQLLKIRAPAVQAQVDLRIDVAADEAAPATSNAAYNATRLFTEPVVKLQWYSAASGPSVPSSMCVLNQFFVGPEELQERETLAQRIDEQPRHAR